MNNMMQKLLAIVGRAAVRMTTFIAKAVGLSETIGAPRFLYEVECVGADGQVKWKETFWNTVLTAGKNDLLTQYFKGAAYTAAWYVGLVDNASFTAIVAGDLPGSHGGWIEAVPYSNGVRPTLTLGTPAAGSVDNSASKASYTINATATINGAFVSANSAKSSTTGILYSAGSFGATRGVISGDTLNVQVTLTIT